MAVLDLDVIRRHAERARRNGNQLLSDGQARGVGRAAAGYRLATCKGADTHRDACGVGECHHHVFDLAAEPVSDDLGERRVRALALAGRAGEDRNFAVGHDANGRSFIRAQASALDVVRKPDADITTRRTRGRLSRGKIVVARGLDH